MKTTTKMPPNPELARLMQEKRRSNAATPHKNKKRYDRKRSKRAMRKEVW